jgi:DnaJ like chaperone protein
MLTGSVFIGILGAVIGSSIGQGLGFYSGRSSGGFNRFQGTGGFRRPQASFAESQNSSRLFFSSLFSMLGKLSVADGSISDKEKQTIYSFMRQDLRLDPVSQQAAMEIFNSAARSGESFSVYARQFYQAFSGNAQFIELLLDILLRVAAADGSIHREEERMIQEAVRIFGYSQTSYDRLKSKYVQSASTSAYSILGCSPSDSDAAVKKAYRTKASEFHPDRVAAKGLPEEFTQFANDRFREIQEAWESIKKERSL